MGSVPGVLVVLTAVVFVRSANVSAAPIITPSSSTVDRLCTARLRAAYLQVGIWAASTSVCCGFRDFVVPTLLTFFAAPIITPSSNTVHRLSTA